MLLTEKVGIILLSAIFLVQCAARPQFPRALRRFWIMGVVGIGSMLVSWSYLIYAGWRANELGKFFLPPYQSLKYFFIYVGERMLAPWGIALIAGVAMVWLTRRMNRKHGGRFFEAEEPSLIGFCFFIIGYPTLFFYLVAMPLVGIGISLWCQMRGQGRAPLYYWWVPVAVFVILLKIYVVPESALHFFVL